MEINVLHLGHIAVNCYLISTENAAIVIDPGFKSSKTEEFLKENSNKERLILLTHAHFDHIGDAKRLKDATGVKIAIGEKDNPALSDTALNLSDKFHAHVPEFSADILLKDEQLLRVGDIEIKVIFTPGHTEGGVSFLMEDYLFSGDTLFKMSIGRTDLPGGNFEVLKNSVHKIFELPNETVVLPGHGEKTTVGYEKKYNPFV